MTSTADLVERSIEIILEHQSPTGAYPACPTFPTYRYSWFRDGAFTAYAVGLVGKRESTVRFFDWAADVINAREEAIHRAVEKAHSGIALEAGDVLHTRYALDGKAADEAWPNFQLDGFGTLLWSLGEHDQRDGRPLPESMKKVAHLIADYLVALWRLPCYDCWEEFPKQIHTHTLAAIYAGLNASQALTGRDHHGTLREIRDFICTHAFRHGHFVKYVGTDDVDASLLGLAVPYALFPLDDPRIQHTVEQIEARLRKGGGVHRYEADTYYGGGEWVLLTAWLGWYYALSGAREKAQSIKHWIEEQADHESLLPEQVPETLNDPAMYKPWRDRWGEIARPLLWSHAKYLILCNALEASAIGR